MSPFEAAKILDLPAGVTTEQIEARFLELRRKLEDKIAKAPTPGLQAKYRESLQEITTAFETLTLAADSSSLPVLRKETGGPKTEDRGQTSEVGADHRSAGTENSGLRSQVSGIPAAKRLKSSKEFALVAVAAVAVLAGGGWFVMKTRAENAEKERIAAEAKADSERKLAAAKAEADRQAEGARLAAETKRKAEEDEKARVAAAAKADQERMEKLNGQLRSQLAELKISWEAIEREERNTERRLAELKSDLRNLRDAPPGELAEAQAVVLAHQDYFDWLSDTLVRHPARIARSKAEEFLSARQIEEAAPLVAEIREAIPALNLKIKQQRQALLTTTGGIAVTSRPSGLDWTLQDAFGRRRSGITPATVSEAAIGQAKLTIKRPGWPDYERTIQIRRGAKMAVEAAFSAGALRLASNVPGAEVALRGRILGPTPLELAEVPVGPAEFTVTAPKFQSKTVRGTIAEGQVLSLSVDLEPIVLTPEQLLAAFWAKVEGVWDFVAARPAVGRTTTSAIAAARLAAMVQVPLEFRRGMDVVNLMGTPCIVETVDTSSTELALRSQSALGMTIVERNGRVMREPGHARFTLRLENDRLLLTPADGPTATYTRR